MLDDVNNTVPPVLLDFVAHVAANRIVLSEWERGNVAAVSAIPFPEELLTFARHELGRVKREQARLLQRRGTRGHDGPEVEAEVEAEVKSSPRAKTLPGTAPGDKNNVGVVLHRAKM